MAADSREESETGITSGSAHAPDADDGVHVPPVGAGATESEPVPHPSDAQELSAPGDDDAAESPENGLRGAAKPLGRASNIGDRHREQAGLSVPLQVLLLASVTVTSCSVLALTVARGYALAVTLMLLCVISGNVLSRVPPPRLPSVATVLLSPLIFGFLVWSGMLGVAIGLCGSALAVAPILLTPRAARLIVPVMVSVAATAAAVVLTFYARPAPGVHANPGVWIMAPTAGPVPRMKMIVLMSFHGCSHPLDAAVEWTPAVGSPFATSTATLKVTAEVTGLAENTETIPTDLADSGPNRGFTMKFTYPAVVSRGIGTCYVALPTLIGPWDRQSAAAFGRGAVRPVVLSEAEVWLYLNGATAGVVRGEAPTISGDPSIWTCNAESPGQPTIDIPSISCSGVLEMMEPWFPTVQNLMLLIIGALFAATVALIGRAVAGFGLFSA